MHELLVTRPRSSRFMLLHAGDTDRNTAGRMLSSGVYHATPNPSPLSGSSDSRLFTLWLMIEWLGSVTSDAIVSGAPWYSTKRHIVIPLSQAPQSPARPRPVIGCPCSRLLRRSFEVTHQPSNHDRERQRAA